MPELKSTSDSETRSHSDQILDQIRKQKEENQEEQDKSGVDNHDSLEEVRFWKWMRQNRK